MFASIMDVQFLLSVLHHNLGDAAKRDEAAERHEQTRLKYEEAQKCVVEDWIEDTWAVVSEIGAAIASR